MTCRILLYSFSENTMKVGETLAWELGAQLHEIKTPVPEPGLWSAIKAGILSVLSKGQPIEVPDQPWHQSDLLILGTPVWGDRMARPMRHFLSEHPQLPERCAFLITSADTTFPQSTVDEMTRLCGRDPVAVLHVTEQEIEAGAARWRHRLDNFLDLCVSRYRKAG